MRARVVLMLAVLMACGARALGVDYLVRTSGNDANNGLTRATALATVSAALQRAMPGDTVRVGAGVYRERVASVRSGASGRPIRVVGDGDGAWTGDAGEVAITQDGAFVVSVDRDYFEMEGLTLRGLGASGSVLGVRWTSGRGGALRRVRVEHAVEALVRVSSGDVAVVDCALEVSAGDGLLVVGGTVRAAGVRVAEVAGRGVVVQNADALIFGHRLEVRGPSTSGVHAEQGRAYVSDCLVSVDGHGMTVQRAGAYALAMNSTLAGNGGDGARVEAGTWYGLSTIVSHNAGVGLRNVGGSLYDNRCVVYAPGSSATAGTVFTSGRIAADPLFADAAGGNYRLRSGSPAIDAGYTLAMLYPSLGWTPIDLDGVSRDAASGYEVGAYEFAGAAAPVPYATGFEGGVDAYWGGTATGTHQGSTYHGTFNGTPGAQQHAELRVVTTPGMEYVLTFDLLITGSWNGSSTSAGPDRVRVLASGFEVFNETFSVGSGAKTYGGSPDAARSTAATKVFAGVTVVFTATAPVTALRWSSSVTGSDEDFGLENVSVREASEGCEPGLLAEWVWGFARPTSVTQIDFSAPALSTVEYDVNWPNMTSTPFTAGVPLEVFAVRLTGFLDVPADGAWGLRLSSDDGSRLWIDGAEVIENDGFHSPRSREATVTLLAGMHRIEIRMFEWTGRQDLVLSWRPPGGAWAVVPAGAFCHSGTGLFEDATVAQGFDAPGTTAAASAGVRIGDVDGDGLLDVFVGGDGARVMWNGGDGTWTESTAGGEEPWRQAALLDADNDGDLDAWVVRIGSQDSEGLLLHEGTRGLSVRRDAGMAAMSGNEGVAAADVDADGMIDVVMFSASGNAVGFNRGEPADPLGPPVTFEADDGLALGLNAPGDRGDGGFVSSADVNDDGRTDFFYHYAGGRLFVSNADATFTRDERGLSVFTAGSEAFGSAWGDYDNDGDMDLFVCDPRDGHRGRLFRNDGAVFAEAGLAAGLTDASGQRSACFGDVDNDGDLDLYVTTGEGAANILYGNNGDGTFTVIERTNAEIGGASHDAAMADLDHDGDLDLVLAREGEPAVLLKNTTDDGAALQVAFVGRGEGQTNRAGVGVGVTLVDGAGRVLGRREIGGARGLGGQETLRAHFGGVDPLATYVVRLVTPGGTRYEASVVPDLVTTTVGGLVIPRLLTFEEPPRPRLRVVRWREVSPVDGD